MRLVFAGMFWHDTVNRLDHRVFITDVAANRQAQPARRRRAVVAHDVAGKIRRDDDVVPFGIANLPLTESIDISIVKFQIWKLACADFPEHFTKETMSADDV